MNRSQIGLFFLDNACYDADRDVLYLSDGEPSPESYGEVDEAGNILRFNRDDELCGYTILNFSGRGTDCGWSLN